MARLLTDWPVLPVLTRSRLSRMAALVRGDDRQILFMLSERYESHAASQIRCRETGPYADTRR
jgi:hypothetical protein